MIDTSFLADIVAPVFGFVMGVIIIKVIWDYATKAPPPQVPMK